MPDIARRFKENPLISPAYIKSSSPNMVVECLLNPGAFYYEGKYWLLLRVAENSNKKEGFFMYPFIVDNLYKFLEVAENHPNLNASDSRVHSFENNDYLTTISHFKLVNSIDGIHFSEAVNYPLIIGEGMLEEYGIEDCRVSKIEDTFYLTYTAVSANGVGVAMKSTKNWVDFESHGMILPPHNKDCAIFEEKINGKYYAFHRPSSVNIGGNFIWLAESENLIHWGNHKCVLKTRPSMWDGKRLGAGAAPIKTNLGWLAIYHGANEDNVYSLGAALLAINEPWKVIGRTLNPIMKPIESYETTGFFNNVVFTNGHIYNPGEDIITVYYGAADQFICGASFSIQEILNYIEPV